MTNNTFDTVKIQFEKFLSSIGNVLTSENETNIIQNKLRRHFNTAASDYLCSDEFISSLNHMQHMFVENNKSRKYFTLLASFDEQLKKHCIKLSRPSPSSTQVSNCPSSITTTIRSRSVNTHTVNAIVPKPTETKIEYQTVVQETIEYLLDQCCKNLSEFNLSKPAHTDSTISLTTNSSSGSKHQRKIIKLERRLTRLSKVIRELEETDMSLDEMVHCDLYIVESNLKKQACQVHNKLAKLKSQSPSIERIIHQPIALNESETGHPLINKDLQEMVNQSKHFPSFSDVLDTVEKANEKYILHLNDESRRNFAEKSFKIIGKEIKNRRMADFNDILYSRLPEDFNIEQNDPALNSAEIEKVLIENEREANIKTEKIFEEFSQIEADPEAEVNIESTEEESAAESEEQEESEMVVESNEIQYDIVDIIPSCSSNPVTPIAPESNSVEAAMEISLNDRPLTILSTASLPMRRSTHDRESEVCNDVQSSSSILSKESEIQTLMPRRKENLTGNEIIYKLYKQRLTNNKSPVLLNHVSKKRPPTKHNENSNLCANLFCSNKSKLFSDTSSRCVASPTASSLSSRSDPQYFFLIRHGIYLSTSNKNDGLIELGRQQAYAAAETIDVLARSLERSSDHSSRILFTRLIQSGYKRAYQTGLIAGHHLEQMQRLERSFDDIFKRFKCWGEIHSIERFRQRWQKIQRLFFSTSSNHNLSPSHYVIFSHGNLLSSIISFLMSGASWDRWHFGNIAPHCSVCVLSYTPGHLLPEIVLTPFQIFNQSLPITINNVNPRKMQLKEIITTGIINEEIWKMIINSIIPERVVGSHTDQISRISKFIPGNEEEAHHMLFIFKEYYSQIMTTKEKLCVVDQNSDSDNEEEEEEEDDDEDANEDK